MKRLDLRKCVKLEYVYGCVDDKRDILTAPGVYRDNESDESSWILIYILRPRKGCQDRFLVLWNVVEGLSFV